ncbi:MAG TPA: prephenate dehydrogenase/arogenate dehydrogenase family protein [Verrucomicrobiae bacterium]|jgi:prephenate dehydrogenase|nr:prephenate dehydrogenase/arogenate dehydrogenase family protein [Verrucomicrobiae bacterium]
MAPLFKKMVIAGVGLIGASLALAARERGLVDAIVGYGRSEENLRFALDRGIIDSYFHKPEEIPPGTDFLLLGTPVAAIVPLTKQFLPFMRPGCIVSDVGSVKAEIVRDMEKLLPSTMPFVGAHPIAGGEQWGAEPARADLFIGQRCILTPTKKTDPAALENVGTLWKRVGAKVETIDADVHDKILGLVSHLPHVLVYGLVNLMNHARVDSTEVIEYCGGGFKDFTRIASSRPELWRDICLLNREAVSAGLADYIKELEKLKRLIDEGKGAEIEREFALANEARRRLS